MASSLAGTNLLSNIGSPGSIEFLLLGDLNFDRSVDAADAALLFANWGDTPPTDAIADINRDGQVDAADASIVFSSWTGDAAPHVVPEPGTGLLSWAMFRRRN